MFFMFLLLACPVAHGAEPTFTTLKKGEEAPFDGRLFNDEAVAKMIVDKRFEGKQCELRVDYELSLLKSQEKYKYDLLYGKCEADDMRLNELINIKDAIGQAVSRDTSYAATYWPWVKMLDPGTGKRVWLPASTVVPGVYAYNDKVADGLILASYKLSF